MSHGSEPSQDLQPIYFRGWTNYITITYQLLSSVSGCLSQDIRPLARGLFDRCTSGYFQQLIKLLFSGWCCVDRFATMCCMYWWRSRFAFQSPYTSSFDCVHTQMCNAVLFQRCIPHGGAPELTIQVASQAPISKGYAMKYQCGQHKAWIPLPRLCQLHCQQMHSQRQFATAPPLTSLLDRQALTWENLSLPMRYFCVCVVPYQVLQKRVRYSSQPRLVPQTCKSQSIGSPCLRSQTKIPTKTLSERHQTTVPKRKI
jgi:hypothetical protein